MSGERQEKRQSALWDLADKIIQHEGMELVDVNNRREGKRWIVRFYIDREGGVTVADCAAISRKLSVALEVEDIIKQNYFLEVSSPGINRPLKKDVDFERAVGKKVKITTTMPLDGSKNFSGVLTKYEEGVISLTLTDKSPVFLKLENVYKARLNLDIKI